MNCSEHVTTKTRRMWVATSGSASGSASASRSALAAALAVAVVGCGSQGTDITPALRLMPPDTEVVAVVDLAVARKTDGWREAAEPFFRMMAAPAAEPPAPESAPAATAGDGAAKFAAPKDEHARKAKLTGPLGAAETLLDDLDDEAHVSMAADVDALVLGAHLNADAGGPLLVALGRGFTDKGLEALLDARDLDADAVRSHGLRYHVVGDAAFAVLDEHRFVAGDEDAVADALKRATGEAGLKSAADSDTLSAALAVVERPSAAWLAVVPDDDLQDRLEDVWKVKDAERAKVLGAWARFDGGDVHVVGAARAADADHAAALAGAVEDALREARKGAGAALPHPYARLLKEAAVATRKADVLVSVDLGASRFLRDVEADGAAADLARRVAGAALSVLAALTPGRGGPGAGSGGGALARLGLGLGVGGSLGGGLSAADTTALVGPLSPYSELVVVADAAGLRRLGVPGSLDALRTKVPSVDASAMGRMATALGLDPLRDVDALAVGFERISLSG
ncbi:MAG TPA: hypothetical protein VG389_06280, partial [Myxococcota bacterium]|nr:hypothetical protein [Myxococcota bacterium]